MIVEQTKDIDLIKSVLCRPDIYDVINDDNSGPAEDFEPPMDVLYVAGYVNDDIIGIMIYHEVTGGLKCHIQVLPEYRKKYAREFARMALNFGEAKNAILYSEIPDCYPNVINFAKEFGFNETGSIKGDYIKNGIAHDVIKMRKNNGVRQTAYR